MKAIFTKYHGPTNTKGSRISASDDDGNRVVISYPYELSGEAVHRKAAQALCDKMGWTGELMAGGYSKGYVFVDVPPAYDALLAACKATIKWAQTSGPHGGNPWCLDFVKLADNAVAEVEGRTPEWKQRAS